ncbi:hypothetical protein PInf_004816 [Phytophthora infestans]|nr:hypothetical protein PInf_004816 [Phytophthora infestans]
MRQDQGSADDATFPTPFCVIDTNSNLMVKGASQCTCLSSDEDPDMREEPKKRKMLMMTFHNNLDWDIGDMTDEESDEAVEELPDSVRCSFVKNPLQITSMRHSGWECGTIY